MRKFLEAPGTVAYKDDANNGIVVITNNKDLTPEIFREEMIKEQMFDNLEGTHYNGKIFEEMSHDDFYGMMTYVLSTLRSCTIRVINV